MGLQRYKAKRNFRKTSEPRGDRPHQDGKKLMFVIQKHAATRLHYDFRLELEGVLKSWAVPKGIPTTKAEKRLAMHVEDHPFDYGDFEGIIPAGNYGAGSVMVWDTGTWEALDEEPRSALKKGKVRFRLEGKKLKGEWTLVRMRGGEEGKEPWLLVKSGESIEPISARADDRSVLSGRGMKAIAAAQDRSWQSNRSTTNKATVKTPRKKPTVSPKKKALTKSPKSSRTSH